VRLAAATAKATMKLTNEFLKALLN